MKYLFIIICTIFISCQSTDYLEDKLSTLDDRIKQLENEKTEPIEPVEPVLDESQNVLEKFENPIDLIKSYYSIQGTGPNFSMRGIFWDRNRDEILESLELVEIFEKNNVGLAFLRFSVGLKIFRKVEWIKKYDNNYWCLAGYISTFSYEQFGTEIGFANWIKEMDDKANKWKAESAEIYID
ncbi:MAG: hypothetical protein HON37_04570 [Candidatus Marinimicrobia bacterium]|jgi:hypothetical protein|nr:hypothetical protein [Candidatus Neomarinimicrobiota bacterium]MBT5528803.1 hypothetical protein [Cytophagia bacterium]